MDVTAFFAQYPGVAASLLIGAGVLLGTLLRLLMSQHAKELKEYRDATTQTIRELQTSQKDLVHEMREAVDRLRQCIDHHFEYMREVEQRLRAIEQRCKERCAA
jgi:hypothetical protein